MKRSPWKRNLLVLFAFGIAMGVLEAVVVVYLRHIYYPAGFDFPLAAIDHLIAAAEWVREICTLVMLLSIALLAGKRALQVFSYFIYSFAVWDIFYYAGLKLFLDWPASLSTWDILFLIPVIWTGPVWAPLLCSLLMILLAGLLLQRLEREEPFAVTGQEWALLLAGAVLIFAAFIWDFSLLLVQEHGLTGLFALHKTTLINLSLSYIPQWFNWPLFLLGILCIVATMVLLHRRSRS